MADGSLRHRLAARLEFEFAVGSVVLVTSRVPNEQLYHRMAKHHDVMEMVGIKTVALIGDHLCPQTIDAAVHSGQLYARELDGDPTANPDVPYRRECMALVS